MPKTGDLGTVKRLGASRIVDREIDRIPDSSAIELEDVLLNRLPNHGDRHLTGFGRFPVPIISTTENIPLKIRRVQLREQLLPTARPVGTGSWT